MTRRWQGMPCLPSAALGPRARFRICDERRQSWNGLRAMKAPRLWHAVRQQKHSRDSRLLAEAGEQPLYVALVRPVAALHAYHALARDRPPATSLVAA